MKILIKKLQGEECLLEVLPSTIIADIKGEISKKLGVPVKDQKLLFLGRTLADNQTIASYPSIKDGSKIYLVIKKPEGFYELAVKHFKRCGMNDSEATAMAKKLLQMIKVTLNRMSWDDIDRLCYDCMMDARGQRRPPVNTERNDDTNKV